MFYLKLFSKVPKMLSAILPTSCLKMHEKAWNCYPYCRTGKINSIILLISLLNNFNILEYTMPALGEMFSCIIETVHLPDNGSTFNVIKLN